MIRYLRSVVLALFAVSLLAIPRTLPAAAQDATPTECPTTTPEENAALARMYWQEAVWGKQGKIADIISPDEVHHWGLVSDTRGLDEFLQRWDLFNKAFPDLEFTVDERGSEWRTTIARAHCRDRWRSSRAPARGSGAPPRSPFPRLGRRSSSPMCRSRVGWTR